MKKTLLALMLVSSLFVISCGADATKPTDAYKSQKTEIASGTKTTNVTVTGNTVDVSTFALPGEKVTEIIEVSDASYQVEKPTTINKNPDGGIYQFTTTTITTPTSVTYKYTKTIIAPIKETTTTATATAGSSESTATVNDPLLEFEGNIISVKDAYGKDIDFSYNGGNTITFDDTTLSGKNITIKYQYMDVYQISEKPTKEGDIEATGITLTQNDAGKTYVCKDVTANTYYYGIVPATGIITLSGTQNNSYQLWLY